MIGVLSEPLYLLPKGLTLHLLTILANKFDLRPDVFLPHFRKLSVESGGEILSQTQALAFSSGDFLYTAQIFDEGVEYKIAEPAIFMSPHLFQYRSCVPY
jgi:hypothetical protein